MLGIIGTALVGLAIVVIFLAVILGVGAIIFRLVDGDWNDPRDSEEWLPVVGLGFAGTFVTLLVGLLSWVLGMAATGQF